MLQLIFDIQHLLNPLHVYCRLIEKGFSKEDSIIFAKLYEEVVYDPVFDDLMDLRNKYLKNKITNGM